MFSDRYGPPPVRPSSHDRGSRPPTGTGGPGLGYSRSREESRDESRGDGDRRRPRSPDRRADDREYKR